MDDQNPDIVPETDTPLSEMAATVQHFKPKITGLEDLPAL